MTFGEYWPIYFQKKALMVKPSTLSIYDLIWNANLKEHFQNTEMDSFRPSQLQAFVDEQIRLGNKTHTIKDRVVVVKNILKIYQMVNDLPVVSYPLVWPTRNKDNSTKPREKFTDQELARLMDYCKNSSDHFTKLVALAAMTGIRIGEAAGIQFGDFDFDTKRVHIQRTVQRVSFHGKKSEMNIGSTKTRSSNRIVPVPTWLCSYFKNYQKLFKLPDDAFINPNTTGSAMDPRTVRVLFYRICDNAGVRRLTFHSLRHTYASRLILSKADIRTVSELLGHSDVTVTLNTYAHSDEDKKDSTAKKIFI